MVLSWTRLGRVGRRRIFHSSIAQSVEHAAVNRRVVGSSPTGGANMNKGRTKIRPFSYSLLNLKDEAMIRGLTLYSGSPKNA